MQDIMQQRLYVCSDLMKCLLLIILIISEWCFNLWRLWFVQQISLWCFVMKVISCATEIIC